MGEIKKRIINDVEKGKKILDEGGDIRDHLRYLEICYTKYIPDIKGMSSDLYSTVKQETWRKRLTLTNEVLLTHTTLIPEDAEGRPIPFDAQVKKGSTINNHNAPVAKATASSDVEVNLNNNISVMFKDVKRDIEDNLDGVLKEDDYEELLSKINELEDIQNTETKRGKKWSKTKGIFNWLTGQGVDVFVKVAPLIMKMMENPT